MKTIIKATGRERYFSKDELIVSKTDLKGRITYTNRTFMKVSGFEEKELLNQPHSLIRHSDMPRCIFKLLWQRLEDRKEIFAYVINICKNGDHYWVLAHVTPSFGPSGEVVGFHSNRRVPDPSVINSVIRPLYGDLLKEEEKYANRKDGMNRAFDLLLSTLQQKGLSYDEFIFSLNG